MNPHYTKLSESIIQFALSRSKAASELTHPGLRGRAREIFAKDLLTPFLSPNVGVCTGIVVDSNGGSSRQIDIIIYDKTLIPSLMFTGEEGIVPIESVLATVEVKSTLTREELKKSVKNAHSVKNLHANFAEVMIETPEKSSPVCCVFSFSSDSKPEKELSRLEEVVSEVNKTTQKKVYVPLSGIGVANTSFTQCVKIENENIPAPLFETTKDNAALKFMVFLIDQVSIMERQRSKMLISHYFLRQDYMENTEHVIVNWYLVAFVDILGQRQLLRGLRALPDKTDNNEKEGFIKILKETSGTVERLRTFFHNFFEATIKSAITPDLLTTEQQEIYKQLKSNPLQSHKFSDFVALFLSLRDDVNKVPMMGVYSALGSVASTLLMMLADGIVIRGGMDVGIGLELRDGDIYGSALSRAYDIESKISQYPRVVLGDEVINYINAQRLRPERSPFDSMNKQLAEISATLIGIDEDGNAFLDYLGEGFRKNIASKLEPSIIEKAYIFVVKQWQKFRAEKKSDLAFRYMLLRDYFENRLHYWFDDVEKIMKRAKQTSSQGFDG